MGFSFEAELRHAERTINNLIAACERNGGGVYIGNQDKTGFCNKLTEPICITYFMPVESSDRNKNLYYVHENKCPSCENNGWDMPQCRECNPENGFKWYTKRR